MKNIFLLLFLFSFQSLLAQKIENRPEPPKAVNDFGNFLEPFQREALEQKLDAYNDSTSSAIVIITVPDLQGYDIPQISLKYLREWGIGAKDKNNGVLILVSKAEKKARIETGFGMEGVLPDILCKQIIDERMIPYFKQDDYYAGFNNAVDAIIQAAAGEYKADPNAQKTGRPSVGTIIILAVIFFIIIGLFSGGGGGGGGSYMSRKGSKNFMGALPWFLLGSMMGGGGGRDGGGGGFGGGGFGGFGGGGGGGGGASGGW
ncbi:MAG: TPM domain-containing protein [Bacteroidota bacterium]|nr:TPM domain-containing protein [Bacteroidota bacterium]